MNNENLEYLKKNLLLTGFGDKLNGQLEKEMAKGLPNFQLNLETEMNNKAFSAVLNFHKSDTTDMYFFNSYYATLGRKDGEVVDQAFYLKDGRGITAKEAFNLLDGRAVHKELTNKEGEKYQAWVQIDFDKRDKNNNHEMKQFHENYGYDLKAAVEKFAVKEMDGGEKEKALMASLMKGNVQSVSIDVKGEPQKMFMEANPQFKTVTLYDEGMKRMQKEAIEPYLAKGANKGLNLNGQEAAVGKEKDKAARLNPEGETPAQKKTKAVKDLMPQKKEVGSKKALKV